jgi:glycyl-tRNA synthetase beta chain
MKPLLIEIGSEEIPARFISGGVDLLKEALTQFFDKSSITYGKINEYSTPRRLALYIEDVTEQQEDRTIEALGPPEKVAFDDKGSPTRAATGFAKSLNIDVKDLAIKETERGNYVAATIEEKGRATKEVLSEALPGIISSLQLPKSMRWGSGSLRYFRPIQWVLALFGSSIIKFNLEELKSSNITYGHRFLSPSAIKIKDPSEYLQQLIRNHVFADPDERKKVISEGIRKVEPSINCKVHKDDELLDIVTNLVEYPTIVAGQFDEKYLSLPDELLITVMKSHQKYFSTEDKGGGMKPFFIVVSNTKSNNNETVRIGAERVLRARLEDARFYFIEDQKLPLWDYTEELKKVTFQEKLGSVFEKAERISVLSLFIADKFKLSYDEKEKLHRASMLCKADLVTGVVGEFPELQGYMGMTYALNSGENREVASAVYEHYLPRYAGDSLPSGETGTIVSLADKMDSIASFFSIGLIPSGSEDPYALRRQAAGIIHMLQGKDYPLPLNALIDKALENSASDPREQKELSEKILEFFAQRLERIFLSQGFSHDIIKSVLSAKEYNLQNLKYKAGILSDFKKDPAFPSLIAAAKRVYNILSSTNTGAINESLLTESSEKELLAAAGKVKDKLAETGYRALFELGEPINTFFDEVLVMDKDPQIKENRLALLSSVKEAFDSLGDFSKIRE